MEGWLPFGGSGLVIFLTVVTLADGAHREHKVHNIVLYPDKHSWCQTLQIKQVISYPGCKSEEIDNNVCVGACFSYSIPHTEPSDPGEVIVPYCDSCQPSDTTWHHVTLECQKNSHEIPPQLVKRVQIINNCSCSPCEKNHHHNRFTHHPTPIDQLDTAADSDDFLTMQQREEVPDLLQILNNRNETNAMDSSHAANMKSIVNHQIVTLLQNIQEKNSQYDKEQLIELLHTIQGPDQHKLSDKTIADFVESLNAENIELDLTRLRQVLNKFEHSKYFEKHRKYSGIDGDDNNNNNEGTIAATSDSSQQQSAAPIEHHRIGDDSVKDTTVVIGADNHSAQRPDDSLTEHQHTVTLATPGSGGIKPHLYPHHHHHHHHHVGEQVLGHGHLTKGPNGALVIEHDDHEKLDVNPHELKPNHAGTLLTYSGQLIEKNKSIRNGAENDDVDDTDGIV